MTSKKVVGRTVFRTTEIQNLENELDTIFSQLNALNNPSGSEVEEPLSISPGKIYKAGLRTNISFFKSKLDTIKKARGDKKDVK